MTTVRTFIVEDNPTIRKNLMGALREVARVDPVGEAESEEEGSRWLSCNLSEWDLAIVDLFLKDGTGFRVLEACRHRGPAQKIVVLSNFATPDMRRRCALLGADAVFDKVTEIEDLMDYCLRRRQAQFSSPAAH
ncbi:response regulator [Variovorax sp. Varisp85]|mgnify:CR=1 FL=1|jgi:DNA-binding NarL/FixJ family response regulator|uniref:response regulator n=1 Tax=unclassified Variovorax TaxID=663243 RepID=UPI0002710A8E|nr:response regulator [Variovorax sp. CF313]EJL68856.1 response regulator containing a CheY-like receiver domain and an HTH DNA-binding domain [Variovorax sp. CF313]